MLDEKRIVGASPGPYLRNVDVQWDFINTDDLPFMDFAPGERERFLLREGDLLVCEGGEVGRCAVWDAPQPVCFYQKALHRLRPRSNREHPRFLLYALRFMAQAGIFSGAANQNTIDHLTAVQLRHYRFAFPPPPEQSAITLFLDRETARIDALLEKKERLIALLEEKRAALITRAVTKGLDPGAPMRHSGVDLLGAIPAHWQVKPIGRISVATGGGTPQRDEPHYWGEGLPWVSPKDMKRRVIAAAEESVTREAVVDAGLKIIPRSSVLIVVRGMILAHTFPVALTTAEVTINQDMKALRFTTEVEPSFMLWVLTGLGGNVVRTVVEEAAHGTKAIRMDQWRMLPVPVPPVEEQSRIVAFVAQQTARIDTLIGRMLDAIARLREYRIALISAAVTGQIDVRGLA